MTTITERRLHLQLSGLVQGVGFRPWSYRLARQLQLRGWVGNNPGGVCLVLEGPEADLQRFLETLQTAPPPRCPALPSPGTRNRVPLSTPPGILIRCFFTTSCTPWP